MFLKSSGVSSALCDKYQSFFEHNSGIKEGCSVSWLPVGQTLAVSHTALPKSWSSVSAELQMTTAQEPGIYVFVLSCCECSGLNLGLLCVCAEGEATVTLLQWKVFCLTKSTACLGMCSSTIQVPKKLFYY